MHEHDAEMQRSATEEELRKDLHREREARLRVEAQTQRARKQLQHVRLELASLRVWYSPAWEKVRSVRRSVRSTRVYVANCGGACGVRARREWSQHFACQGSCETCRVTCLCVVCVVLAAWQAAVRQSHGRHRT